MHGVETASSLSLLYNLFPISLSYHMNMVDISYISSWNENTNYFKVKISLKWKYQLIYLHLVLQRTTYRLRQNHRSDIAEIAKQGDVKHTSLEMQHIISCYFWLCNSLIKNYQTSVWILLMLLGIVNRLGQLH